MSKTISLVAKHDITLPDVSLVIGGKNRQLAYDFAAIVKAEQLTGINLMKAITFQDLRFTDVRGLLYAALLHDEPTLTLEEFDRTCGPHIMHNLVVVQAAVLNAWFGSMPDPEEVAPGEAQAQTSEV